MKVKGDFSQKHLSKIERQIKRFDHSANSTKMKGNYLIPVSFHIHSHQSSTFGESLIRGYHQFNSGNMNGNYRGVIILLLTLLMIVLCLDKS